METTASPAANSALATNEATMVGVRPNLPVRWCACAGSRTNTTKPGAKTSAISFGDSADSACNRSSRSIHSPASAAAVTADTTISGTSRRSAAPHRSRRPDPARAGSCRGPRSREAMATAQAALPSQNSSA
ncbi:hypothetical protein ACWCYZ_30160 [Streptomyces virginiae]